MRYNELAKPCGSQLANACVSHTQTHSRGFYHRVLVCLSLALFGQVELAAIVGIVHSSVSVNLTSRRLQRLVRLVRPSGALMCVKLLLWSVAKLNHVM